MLTLEPSLEDQGQTPWSMFQDGSNGEPTGQRPERADAEARRPPIHAGPCPGPIGLPARRSRHDFARSRHDFARESYQTYADPNCTF
ncbi:hypothetical protein CQW23_33355 [Capsicum baccatum]|uniref:Uncharacterized protein n=1 Tax=Capsicum baccatum TaxID=33114 RepID=A0A2G2V243_CAPBA|nr:hypothetical protein CQW23_33355 [Capsicum baccatum]